MSWEETRRIQQLESQVRKLNDHVTALYARIAALEPRRVLTVRGTPIEEFQQRSITLGTGDR